MDPAIERAAKIIRDADALLITAGAGMGVDSGLPDFRGNEGFWNAYPPYRKLGKSFVEMANPAGFSSDPAFAWRFYGHRLNLYRKTEPHHGLQILRKWCDTCAVGSFVMTSNVDGHFQKAGFAKDRIYEVHGSIHHLQCSAPCGESDIHTADHLQISIGYRIRATSISAGHARKSKAQRIHSTTVVAFVPPRITPPLENTPTSRPDLSLLPA
jgi:NAD-dependent SIR2 family protein deacetylase